MMVRGNRIDWVNMVDRIKIIHRVDMMDRL